MSTFASFLLLAAATGGGSCPDQVAEPRPARIEIQGVQTCGTAFTGSFSGIEVKSNLGTCPLFALITPAHAISKHVPDSGTYTVPAGTFPVRLVTFYCHEKWLLGFIPVGVGSVCLIQSEQNTGVVTHYEQHPCQTEPR